MELIVGLGNPGEKYKNTRHNTGFLLLDRVVEGKGLSWKMEGKFQAALARDDNCIYAKPQTFMNNSGDSVQKLVDYFEIDIEEYLFVVHDDVDLEFGVVKKQFGRSSAGHKGVEDIVQKLGTQSFWRVRIGVGKPQDNKIDTESWVLMNFEKNELELLEKLNLGI